MKYLPLKISTQILRSKFDARKEFYALAEDIVALNVNGIVSNVQGEEDTQFYDVVNGKYIVSVKSSLTACSHRQVLAYSRLKRGSVIYGIQYGNIYNLIPQVQTVMKKEDHLELGIWDFTTFDMEKIESLEIDRWGRLQPSQINEFLELKNVKNLKYHPNTEKATELLDEIENLISREPTRDEMDKIINFIRRGRD